MKSGTSRRAEWVTLLRTRYGRRARAAGTVVGVLAAAGLGFAPSAAAYDAQSQQWYLGPMQAEKMWKTSTGEDIKAAVIGTGVNPDTPLLRGQVLQGVDALVKDGLAKGSVTNTNDTTGQGTTAAELIAGTGMGGGLKRLAPGVKITPIRVPPIKHDELPDPNYPLATAVKAAVDSGAKIIDFTIGNQYVIGTQTVGDAAFDYAVKKGVLMIAGVGDNAKEGNKPQFPAAYRHVVGVSAVDKTGTVSKMSQYGNYVDLAAPGAGMPRWCGANFQQYCSDGSGAVAASALTSASAALIWSAHPNWTANQVVRSLIDTAGRTWPKDDPSKYLGYGPIRPRKVLENADYNPGPPNVNPLAAEDGEKPAQEGEPSAPASASSQPSKKAPVGERSAAGSSGGGNMQVWGALGAGTLAVIRTRRTE